MSTHIPFDKPSPTRGPFWRSTQTSITSTSTKLTQAAGVLAACIAPIAILALTFGLSAVYNNTASVASHLSPRSIWGKCSSAACTVGRGVGQVSSIVVDSTAALAAQNRVIASQNAALARAGLGGSGHRGASYYDGYVAYPRYSYSWQS